MNQRAALDIDLRSRSGVGCDPGLPAVVEGLLVDVVADGFALYRCGGQASPTALIASYEWEGYVDLITIRSFDRVTAARVPIPYREQVDVFAHRCRLEREPTVSPPPWPRTP